MICCLSAEVRTKNRYQSRKICMRSRALGYGQQLKIICPYSLSVVATNCSPTITGQPAAQICAAWESSMPGRFIKEPVRHVVSEMWLLAGMGVLLLVLRITEGV